MDGWSPFDDLVARHKLKVQQAAQQSDAAPAIIRGSEQDVLFPKGSTEDVPPTPLDDAHPGRPLV